MTQPSEGRPACVSACREKERLGIKHGWCNVCESERANRCQTCGVRIESRESTGNLAEGRPARLAESIRETLKSIITDGDRQPIERLLWRLKICEEQLALVAASGERPELSRLLPTEWAEAANSAKGLCESEANRWDRTSPGTAAHWRSVATRLGSLYLTQDHLVVAASGEPPQNLRERLDQLPLYRGMTSSNEPVVKLADVRAILEGEKWMTWDYPTAWAYIREQHPDPAEHDPRCSWVQMNGGMLCDCRVINEEYARRLVIAKRNRGILEGGEK